MADLGSAVPGFAGIWYDSAGTLTIALTDLREQENARAVVADFLRGRAAARLHTVDAANFRFVQVRYSFAELKAAYDNVAIEMLQRPDVHAMDIDEVHNAITAFVASPANVAAVKAALLSAGVAAEQSRVIVEAPTVRTTITLDSADNPLRGGFNFGSNDSGHGTCTSAFNMRFYGSSTTYMATASHCSKNQGLVDSGCCKWYNTDAYVGYEAYDVGWITCGSFKCQDADVAFVDYSIGGRTPSFGRIANTTGWYSTVVSQTDTLEIIGVELYPIYGETVQRIGRMTGKTFGEIYYTCVDIKAKDENGAYTGYIIKCSTRANYGSVGGDSGGPVFAGGLGVVLYGVNWGVHAFSGMLQIENYFSYYGTLTYY
jgi:hypothetical protein